MNPDQQSPNANNENNPTNTASSEVNAGANPAPETTNQVTPNDVVADSSTSAAPTESAPSAEPPAAAPEVASTPDSAAPTAMADTATTATQPPAPEAVSAPEVNAPTVTPITPQPPKKSKKGIIIAIVAFVIIAIIAAVAIFMLTGKKSTTTSSVQSKKASSSQSVNNAASTKTTQSANTTTTAAKAIPGYVTLDKLCYSIQVPKENDAGAENSCLFSAHFGAQKLPGINFTYFTKPSEGLDANVASLKESEAKLKNTLFSEANVKIGGIDSKKLIFKGTGYSSETQTVHYLIPTNKYKVNGVPITGFYVISSLYEKPENKTIIDNIMSSIQWK